jgi:hypothetical protein
LQNYLEDQTALLVQSIQPLVNLIRSNAISTPADEQQIYDYIQDIAQAVEDTGNKTYDAVDQLGNSALKKHAIPVVDVLDECRQSMLGVDIRGGGRERIPPLAFKTARALKVRNVETFSHVTDILTSSRNLFFASTASSPASSQSNKP